MRALPVSEQSLPQQTSLRRLRSENVVEGFCAYQPCALRSFAQGRITPQRFGNFILRVAQCLFKKDGIAQTRAQPGGGEWMTASAGVADTDHAASVDGLGNHRVIRSSQLRFC